MKFDRHIGSTAAEVPVKFQSDTNLAASILYEILRKDVFSDIETGPKPRNAHGHIYKKILNLIHAIIKTCKYLC